MDRGIRDCWRVSFSLRIHIIPKETSAILLVRESDSWLSWIPYLAGTVCGVQDTSLDLERVWWKCSVQSKSYSVWSLAMIQRLAWEKRKFSQAMHQGEKVRLQVSVLQETTL